MSKVAVALLVLAFARSARADDCAGAYERAQEHKADGRLRAARAELLRCTQSTCAAFIQTDCHRWLDEVDAAMPTVVFSARVDGRDTDQVRVTENKEALALHLDGRAIPFDPGKHVFTFDAADVAAVNVEVLVVEGQKNRVVEVALRSRADMARAPVMAEDPWPEHPPGEQPFLTRYRVPLILAGVGAAGFGAFAAFGSSGLDQERKLKRTCAPACDGADVQAVRDKYLLADVGLGIGIASLGAAAYLAVREATAEPERPSRVAWTVSAGPRVTALIVRTTF
jgi:hypothetical protein